jgi:para-nitrobenzyl esterase
MPFHPSRVLLVLAVCALAPFAQREEAVRAQTPTCLVRTESGDVQGMVRGGTCTYLGVPYAASTAGNFRWRPPQPRASWTLLTATAPPPTCPSVNPATGAAGGSEDCLTLNIWARALRSTGRGVPVIVWLHTGGFVAASSNFPGSDGQRFAEERDAIVVAPNYRLGPFGFLSHSALATEDPNYASSGNYGLADQRMALRWVRNNIAAFGGDPNNVTVGGTSAGATSVGLHLVSPASRGLFHRAVIQSGYVTARWPTSGEAERQGDALATALGCTNRATIATCLRAATQNQVLQALPVAQLQITEDPSRAFWSPVVDGFEIPDQPRELYRRGLFSRVPLIIGTNGDEGWTFVDRSFAAGLDALQYERTVRTDFGMDADAVLRLYPATAFSTPKDALARVTADVEFVCEARRIARVMHHDGAPVYVYSFEYPLEGVTSGRAFHGLESNFLFGNNFTPGSVPGVTVARALTAADLALHDTMSAFWRWFMERGDPNPPGQPVSWPTYRPGPLEAPIDPSNSDRYFVFGDRFGVNTSLRDPQCNFWESFYFRSVLGPVSAAAR